MRDGCLLVTNDSSDDQSSHIGCDIDVIRYTKNASNAIYAPIQDFAGLKHIYQSGSIHSGACNMSFGDGSVRPITYEIDAEVHRRLGNRKDRLTIDAGQF